MWLSAQEAKKYNLEDPALLSGWAESLCNPVLARTKIQLCIVYILRNSLKLVSWKDYEIVTTGLWEIYLSPQRSRSQNCMEHFAEQWNEQYPQISKSWDTFWHNLTVLFEYPPEIRKAAKQQKMLVTEESAMKMVYVAIGTESYARSFSQSKMFRRRNILPIYAEALLCVSVRPSHIDQTAVIPVQRLQVASYAVAAPG